MDLSESDRLSLLALIVAVVALIVSAWQLAQQLFATATDGKRFCQASVMGVWARKTRLSWRWSQIRFETKYTTPDIRLSSGVATELLRKLSVREREQYFGKRRLMCRIPIFRQLTEILNGPAGDFERYFDITGTTGDEPWELRQACVPGSERDPKSALERCSRWWLKLWQCHRSPQEDSADIVTWPNLLRSMYGNQVKSISGSSAKFAGRGNGRDSEEGVEKGEFEQAPSEPINDGDLEDRIVIRLVERSWDLVPPDVVRPLAKSTIGSMIVIAHRFGMQWHEFNPGDGKMSATGYGHEISCETIRGLGTVFQYTFREESRRIKDSSALRGLLPDGEYFAPTEVADKLHCGILPVDKDAIYLGPASSLKDVQLVNSARHIDLESLYKKIGIQREVSNEIDQSNSRIGSMGPGRHFRHAIEDAISLLCPIAVPPTSRAHYIMWPLRNKYQPFTPLRQRPGVEELERMLRTASGSNQRLAAIMDNREGTVLAPLERSPLEYLNEICNGMQAANPGDVLVPGHNRKQGDIYILAPRSYLSYIKKIHKETSEAFKLVDKRIGLMNGFDRDEDERRPFFLDLIGAHVTMAAKHGETADKTALGNAPLDESEPFVAGRMRFVQELAKMYATDIEAGPGRTVGKHLRRKGYTKEQIKPFEITALWWVLILRAVCWWTTVQLKLPESQIPSYWYYSQTPVYIA